VGARKERSGLESALYVLFKRLDLDHDGFVSYGELQAGLDAIFAHVSAIYRQLATALLQDVERKGTLVHRYSWDNACAEVLQRCALLSVGPAAVRAVAENWAVDGGPVDVPTAVGWQERLLSTAESLDYDQVRRLAQQRAIFQECGSLLGFAAPHSEEFAKQRLPGMSGYQRLAGLRSFEPCPEGYVLMQALGKGSFGHVFLVRNVTTGQLQAMKRVNREQMQKLFDMSEDIVLRFIENEFRHLLYTHHPHVIQLVDFCQDVRYTYFIMEVAQGGDLSKLVKQTYGQSGDLVSRKLSETYVAVVLQQALSALQYLHRDFKMHKDVKAENMVLMSAAGPPHVALIDLSFMEFSEAPSSKPQGTPHTMAPEVIATFLGRRPQGFDYRCDIYSLGVVAFELLTGESPYKPTFQGVKHRSQIDWEGTLRAIEAVDVAKRLGGRSKGAVDMVRQMLTFAPEQRPSALECLHHAWLLDARERRSVRQLRQEGRRMVGRAASAEVSLQAGRWMLRQRKIAITTNLLRFSNGSATQRVAAYHLIKHVPIGNLRRVIERFEEMDQQLTGILSYDEIASFLVEFAGVDKSCGMYVASVMDIDGSGYVDFKEFATACVALGQDRASSLLRSVFGSLEAVGDCGVAVEEAHALLDQAREITETERKELGTWLKVAAAQLQNLEGRLSFQSLQQCLGLTACSINASL